MLSTENKTALTNCYKDWLRTPTGMSRLRQAVELKREWNATKDLSDIQVKSDGVNPSYLDVGLVRIDITPIGLNNMCHINSDLFASTGRFKAVCGLNVTACPCGRRMCFELHSVNKMGGDYYDFTKDFNEETYKYFIPLVQNSSIDIMLDIRETIGGGGMFGVDVGKCSCNITWIDAGRLKMSVKQLKTLIDRLNICNSTIYNL
jgi:hypothetical protein